MDHHPAVLVDLVARVQFASRFPQMFASMIQIDDLSCIGEVYLELIPDPFRSIAHHHFLRGAAPTPLPGFQVHSLAELLGGFNRPGVGGRIWVADWITLHIPPGLS